MSWHKSVTAARGNRVVWIKSVSDNLTSRSNFNSALLPSCHESMNAVVVVIVDVTTM